MQRIRNFQRELIDPDPPRSGGCARRCRLRRAKRPDLVVGRLGQPAGPDGDLLDGPLFLLEHEPGLPYSPAGFDSWSLRARGTSVGELSLQDLTRALSQVGLATAEAAEERWGLFG